MVPIEECRLHSKTYATNAQQAYRYEGEVSLSPEPSVFHGLPCVMLDKLLWTDTVPYKEHRRFPLR